MRILSKNEKELCRQILLRESYFNYIELLVEDKLGNMWIELLRETNEITLWFEIPLVKDIHYDFTKATAEKVEEINRIVLEAVNLLTLLEKDGYIMLLQTAVVLPKKTLIGEELDNINKASYSFQDTRIKDLLFNYIDKKIYITDEFKEFCKHNFIDRVERRFRTQKRISVLALIIAFLAVLTNIFLRILLRQG